MDGRATSSLHVFRIPGGLAGYRYHPGRALSLVEAATGRRPNNLQQQDARPRYWPIKNPRYGCARLTLPPLILVFYIVAFGFSPSPDRQDVNSIELSADVPRTSRSRVLNFSDRRHYLRRRHNGASRFLFFLLLLFLLLVQ